MNVEHFTIYFDPERFARDGRGFCADWDHPDNKDGTRSPGETGWRFATPELLGQFITNWYNKGK
jgi:hypothetical protein